MKLKQLYTDDDAVSPVIGVILMVAITVILAAVIGTFVLGLGNQVQSSSPTASISFDQQGVAGNSAKVKISHDGGDPLKTDQIDISNEDAQGSDSLSKSASDWDGDSNGEIAAGDTVTVTETSDSTMETGDIVKVVWTADGGGSSNVLADFEVE